MSKAAIRPIALSVFYYQGRILVIQLGDAATGNVFYRPIGGGIRFGEPSAETIVREVREELGVEIVNPVYLGTLENIFTTNARQGHEIVQMYNAEFQDRSLYDREVFTVTEENGNIFQAYWKEPRWFEETGTPLYPNGLPELLGRCFG